MSSSHQQAGLSKQFSFAAHECHFVVNALKDMQPHSNKYSLVSQGIIKGNSFKSDPREDSLQLKEYNFK
jgi:hypothetical protein